MSKRLGRVLVLLAVAALAGCATEMLTDRDKAMMAGRYAELEKRAEEQVPDIHTAKTAKLTPLCMAYSKLKRYDKLNPCLDQLEKNVAAGDTNMTDMEATQKQSPFLAGLAQLGSAMTGISLDYDVSPQLWEVRAETAMDLGQPGRAVEYGKKMIASIPTQWNLERYARIHALGVLALAEAQAGATDAAHQRAQELAALSTSYPYTLLKTDKLVFLSRIYIALGDYPKAYEFASEDDNSVMRGFADLVSGGATLEGGTLLAFEQLQRKFIRNKSALETGRFDEARAGYDEMLANPATPENGDLYWIVLYDRGRIAEHEGKLPEAIDFYRRSVEVIERQRSFLNTEASKIGFFGNKQSVYRDLILALVRQGRATEAFEYVERAKSRALVDMLAAKNDFAIRGADPAQVRALLEAAGAAETEAQVVDSPEGFAQKRGAVERTREELERKAPELASLVAVSAVGAGEIEKRLPAGETLVEYYYGDGQPELFAFVVTGASLRVETLDARGLDESVRKLRHGVQYPLLESAWRKPAQELYDRLIRPLGLSGERLTIVAHGALHYLPFNALHDGNHFLIETMSIRLLPAASVLRFIARGQLEHPGQLLAFGNPDLGNARYDLPFAQEEAEAVAKELPRSRALVRKQASKTAFARYASGFRYLHIASHGDFNAASPLDSALLLAHDGNDNGELTVGELYSMRIDADLVTLSACETGLGKIASGDDVVGLTRGFLYSGARSIVASLWQVDDRATETLMTSFYRALVEGGDKRAALRQAQLETMKRYPHPFYWAAFQLTGRNH